MRPTYQINSYVGAGDLRFGMTPDEIRAVLGPAVSSARNRKGGVEEYREGIKVCYTQPSQTATDFVLFQPAAAIYKGVDLLQADDPIAVLMNDDPVPLEGMGIVVFFALGLTITGFIGTDASDNSVTVFAEGRWDGLRSQLKPLSLPRRDSR